MGRHSAELFAESKVLFQLLKLDVDMRDMRGNWAQFLTPSLRRPGHGLYLLVRCIEKAQLQDVCEASLLLWVAGIVARLWICGQGS